MTQTELQLGTHSAIVGIRRHGPWLAIDRSDLQDLLIRELSAVRHQFEPGGPLGFHRTPQRVLFVHRRGHELLVPPGLLHRIIAILEQHGHGVELASGRGAWREAPDELVMELLPAADQQLVRAVAGEYRATVAVSTEKDIPRRVLALMTAFPQGRMVVAIASAAEAARWRQRLRNAACAEVKLLSCERRHTNARLAVADLHVLQSQNWADDWEIVVVPNATDALGKQMGWLLLGCVHQQVVAFITGNQYHSLKSHELMHLEAVLGPVVHLSGVRAVQVKLVYSDN